MRQITLKRFSYAAAFFAMLPLGNMAAAQAPAAPQPTVAMVDVQKAGSAYKGTKSANDEINKLVADIRMELETRASHKLMTDAELTELISLKKKSPPTEADSKRIDELEKIVKQRDEEVNTLSQKSDPSDAERARLRELKELSNKNSASINTLSDDYAQQVDKRRTELQDKVTADLLAAVAKVAQQKGLATVVDKVIVLYGGIDVTDDVIKALNGG